MDEGQKTMFNSVITMGQNTLKYALLVNAGAAVVMVLFLNSMIGIMADLNVVTLKAVNVASIINSAWAYGLGTACATIAFGVSYGAQFMYALNSLYGINLDKYGYCIHAVAAALIVLSYIMFILGGYRACMAFVV